MKLSLIQMSMSESLNKNCEKSLTFCDKAQGSNLVFFPEIQLCPFFPQYEGRDASKYCLKENAMEITDFCKKAVQYHYYLSPNVYMELNGKRYDTSLWINPKGKIVDYAKMVHIAQAKQFYEQDYYTPSDDGFKVFDTPHGKVGIVICYDRHLPESIRTCALMGAQLIIIPTANTKAEPMELFEWEVRVQAMQNQVFVAMCNRVGTEGGMVFSGESLVVAPDGSLICKADDNEQILSCEINLEEATKLREKVPYITTRRKEWYL